MSIEKVVSVDRIEVVENGIVQVRTKTAFVEDGKQVSCSFHRHTVAPGQDYSNEDEKVKAICLATHTPDVVSAYTNNTSNQGV